MTLLSLLVATYKAVQRKLDEQHTYDSMAHMDERLLLDVGVCRQGNRIVAMAAVNEAVALKPVAVTQDEHEDTQYAGLGVLQDTGG